MFPTVDITYEGLSFPAPKETEKALSVMYGYLGPNAVFNPETKLYEKANQQ